MGWAGPGRGRVARVRRGLGDASPGVGGAWVGPGGRDGAGPRRGRVKVERGGLDLTRQMGRSEVDRPGWVGPGWGEPG